MLSTDQYAYLSNLKRQNPIEKLVFALLTLSICLWADCIYISIAVLLIMAWVSIFKGGTPTLVFLKLLLLPMSFLVLGVMTIAVGISQDQESMLFYFPFGVSYLGVSKTGMITAGNLFFKALGAVSCLYYLSLNTPMIDLLAALRRFKCPKLFVELMELIYRFIFLLLETADTMITAQSSRLGYSSVKSSYRSMGALASTLFIKAYKHTDQLYTALEARGYDGELNVLEETFSNSLRGYILPVSVDFILMMAALYMKQC